MGASLGKSKSKQQSTSTQALTPNNDILADRARRMAAWADSSALSGGMGVGMGTAAPTGDATVGGMNPTLQGLLGYNYTPVSWQTVSTDKNVGQDQINHYMNPALSAVVDATKADMEQNRQLALRDNAGLVSTMAQWGNSRRGVPVNDINSQFDRNQASVLGGLRSEAFNNAVNWGMQDLVRRLTADTTNSQGLLTAGTANQNAAQQAAALRLQALGLQSQDEIQRQQLANQAYGLLYSGPLTQQQSTGSSSGFQFGISRSPSAS